MPESAVFALKSTEDERGRVYIKRPGNDTASLNTFMYNITLAEFGNVESQSVREESL
jgi:hypothetical protein